MTTKPVKQSEESNEFFGTEMLFWLNESEQFEFLGGIQWDDVGYCCGDAED